MKKDKILLLGASSYVGRNLFKTFDSSEVIGTYTKNAFSEKMVFFDATNMSLGDIIKKDENFSHAVILYANAKMDSCKEDVSISYNLNVESTKKVINELFDRNIKPIFVSSEYVFDGKKGNYVEEDIPIPTTVYGSQKLEVEKYLSNRCEDYVILRLAKVFGTELNDNTILSNWINDFEKEREICCAYDQVFSPIHVSDVVRTINRVIHSNIQGTFHVSGEKAVSRLEMLENLIKYTTKKIKIRKCRIGDFRFLEERPLNLSMTSNRIRTSLGLKFKTLDGCCEEIISKWNESEKHF